VTPSKRPASASGHDNSKKQKKDMGSPFDRLPHHLLTHSPSNSSGMRLWIQGSTDSVRREQNKKQLCWLCNEKGHGLNQCKKRQERFSKKEFCFYPK